MPTSHAAVTTKMKTGMDDGYWAANATKHEYVIAFANYQFSARNSGIPSHKCVTLDHITHSLIFQRG